MKYLFPLFLLVLLTPAAAQERKNITAGEILAGQQMFHGDVLLSPDGRWLAIYTTQGQGFINMETGKMANAGSLARAEYWNIDHDAPITPWSPIESRLSFSLHREGRSRL